MLPVSGALWSTWPLCSEDAGDGASGEGEQARVWEGMKGFHGNLCLPVTKVALQIPQASFPWT